MMHQSYHQPSCPEIADASRGTDLLGVPQPSVSRLLAPLRKDRVIERVKESGPGRAAEYYWVSETGAGR